MEISDPDSRLHYKAVCIIIRDPFSRVLEYNMNKSILIFAAVEN